MDWNSTLEALRAQMPDADKPAHADVPQQPDTTRHDTVHLEYQKKGRAGKPATIIYGFTATTDDRIEALASSLKKTLGCGGSTRNREILLQGDRTEQLRRLLPTLGFTVK